MQIYTKEKIKNKKKKRDKHAECLDLMVSVFRKMKSYGFMGEYNSDKKGLEKSYIELCKKYGFAETILKDKNTFVYELNTFKEKEMKDKLKKNKTKNKKTNSEIIFDALSNDPFVFSSRNSNKEDKDPHKVKSLFLSMNNYDEKIQKNATNVFSYLNRFKKLFNNINIKNPYIFKTLVFIVKNDDLWIKREVDFISKSKNIERTILDLFNYFFFEYPITKNEMFLSEHNEAMRTFIKTKSMKKTVDKHYSSIGLTKKQINRIKNYKMLINHTLFKDFLFEIKFNDIVNDNFVTKEMVFKDDKDFVIEYAHYIINVIFKEPMFSKVQIAPLFDYATRKRNELRIEGKKFTFKNRCLVNLFNEMEDWHKRISVSKTRKNLNWDKSYNVIERIYEKFKDESKSEAELKLPNNYSYHEIVEINSSVELKKEGRILKHCVGSYDKQCYNGTIRIFSLRFKGYDSVNVKSLITIQIDREERITQARGNSNRMPTANENNIIKKWANENLLSF